MPLAETFQTFLVTELPQHTLELPTTAPQLIEQRLDLGDLMRRCFIPQIFHHPFA